jgi:hypothetical protein
MIGGSRRAEARLDFGPLGHARQQAFVQLLPLQLHLQPRFYHLTPLVADFFITKPELPFFYHGTPTY